MFQTAAPDYRALLDSLAQRNAYRVIQEADAAEFMDGVGDRLLLCLDDLQQYPESWDMAVVLADVLRSANFQPHVGLAGAELTRMLKPRYGFSRFPALVFLRNGGYVGVIQGMRDWQPFVQEVIEMSQRPSGRAPTIGIPIAVADSACR